MNVLHIRLEKLVFETGPSVLANCSYDNRFKFCLGDFELWRMESRVISTVFTSKFSRDFFDCHFKLVRAHGSHFLLQTTCNIFNHCFSSLHTSSCKSLITLSNLRLTDMSSGRRSEVIRFRLWSYNQFHLAQFVISLCTQVATRWPLILVDSHALTNTCMA